MTLLKQTDLILFSINDIREIETKVAAENPGKSLMKKAGKATAALAKKLIENNVHPVLIVAGPGNNGGDACAAAADLAKDGYQVIVVLCADPATYSEGGKKYFEKALSRKVIFKNSNSLTSLLKQDFSLIIDGLFGIGLHRPIAGIEKEVVLHINDYAKETHVPVLSIDVPSGLNADTGAIVRSETEEGVCVKADYTITFLGNKLGLHTADGKDYAGKVIISDLDIEPIAQNDRSPKLNAPASFQFTLPRRNHNSHKGNFGQVAIIGGAKGMVGASILAGRTALFAGAGKVTIGFLSQAPSFDILHPEIMCHDADQMTMRYDVIVIGPGLGTTEAAKLLLSDALRSNASLVIDADALNLIAMDQALQDALSHRNAASVLTPHPLEAARLLQESTETIQSNRPQHGLALAEKFNATVILKGSGSIICDQQGQLRVNTSGNSGLATGGTGDVLAGLCGALLGQGLSAFDAAQLATWLHGQAADDLLKKGNGPVGMSPSELPFAIRHCLNNLIKHDGKYASHQL